MSCTKDTLMCCGTCELWKKDTSTFDCEVERNKYNEAVDNPHHTCDFWIAAKALVEHANKNMRDK